MKKLHNFDEVFDSQAMFRIILEAMANPMRRLSILMYADKLFGSSPTLLSVAMTLLDNETSFFVLNSDELSEQITLLTHTRKEERNQADYIFIANLESASNTMPDAISETISEAKCGTLIDPQNSATLIIADNGDRNINMSFNGPGIDKPITVKVSELVKEAVTLRDSQNYEYPQGIDMIFISEQGELFCIPRTTHGEEE